MWVEFELSAVFVYLYMNFTVQNIDTNGTAAPMKDASTARRARPRCFAPFFAACPALRRRLRTAVALSGLSSPSVLRTLLCGLPCFARRPNPVLCLCSASLGRGSLDNNVFFLTIPSAAAGSPAEFSTRRPAFPASAAMPPGRWTRRPSAGKRLHSGRHVRR